MVKAVTKERFSVPILSFRHADSKVSMSRIIKAIGILMMSVSVTPSVLADSPSITFAVTGNIIPSSCDITAPQGGDYNFGDISHTLINSTDTKLAAKTQTWNISCDGSTFLMVSSQDNKNSSVTNTAYNAFGLGLNGDVGKVGYYTAEMSNLIVDGEPAQAGGYTNYSSSFYSIDDPSDRTFFTYDSLFFPSTNGLWIAWAKGRDTLLAGKNFSADITVEPVLARATSFGEVTTDVSLEGSMTMNFSFGI